MTWWRPGGALGPGHVRRLLATVLDDVRATGAVEPVLTETALQVWLYAGGATVHGIAVRGDLDPERALAAVAAQVRDWEVEELDRRGRRAVWPACPLHRDHGLEPDVVAGRASWVCPTGDAAAGRVGGLATAAAHPGPHPAPVRLLVPRQPGRPG